MNDNVTQFENGECKEVQKLLDDFLSDELSIETNRRILAHLAHCQACEREREYRVELRSNIRSAWNSLKTPAKLRSRINPVGHFAGWHPLRVAAALLIPVFGAVLFALFSSDGVLDQSGPQIVDHYRLAVADHLNCAGRPMDGDSPRVTGKTARIRDVLQQRLPDYRFVGVMECEIEEAVFTHYLFRGGSGILSVIIERHGENDTLPRRGSALALANLTLRSVNEGPVVVTSMDAAGYFVYVIGDGFSRQRTVALTEAVAPNLHEALLQAG